MPQVVVQWRGRSAHDAATERTLMRIGLDARMVFYTSAGIAQYIRRLVKGLSHVVTDDEIILLQSRKDEPKSIESAPFSWQPLWTPGHNRFEQATLPLELLPYRLELL